MKRYLAWDPGASGGFAWMSDGNLVTHKTRKIKDIHMFLISALSQTDEFVFEFQTGYTGTFNSSSSMFTYGTHYGTVLSAIDMYNTILRLSKKKEISIQHVSAAMWQKSLDIQKQQKVRKPKLNQNPTRDQKDNHIAACKRIDAMNAPVKTSWKRSLRDAARKMYKNDSITLENCDVSLILNYAINNFK